MWSFRSRHAMWKKPSRQMPANWHRRPGLALLERAEQLLIAVAGDDLRTVAASHPPPARSQQFCKVTGAPGLLATAGQGSLLPDP
jgi:hypothetical protein